MEIHRIPHTDTPANTHTCTRSRHTDGNGHVMLTHGVRATCGRSSCSCVGPLLGSEHPAPSLGLFPPHPTHSPILPWRPARETSLGPPAAPPWSSLCTWGRGTRNPLGSVSVHRSRAVLDPGSGSGALLLVSPLPGTTRPLASSTVSGSPLSTFLQGSSWPAVDRCLCEVVPVPWHAPPWEGTFAWFSFPAETPTSRSSAGTYEMPGKPLTRKAHLCSTYTWGQEALSAVTPREISIVSGQQGRDNGKGPAGRRGEKT